MLEDLAKAYEEAGLEGQLCGMMPDMIAVCMPDDATYVPLNDDTPEGIMDLIARSQKAGRNLFLEEWELWEPEPGWVY